MSGDLPHTGAPISETDEEIAALLEDVSVPTLIASMVHLTGDLSWLRDGPRPAGIYINEIQGFMSPDDQATVRRRALEAIVAHRDGDGSLPPPPSSGVVHEIMETLVGGPVPREYVPLLLEELELDGVDHRAGDWPAAATPERRAALPVVVIGAGMAGLLAGIRLGQAGVPYTIVEKNSRVGGTWHENRYPGCRVDVGNHFYCYSFQPDDGWSELFAQQPELQNYFEQAADDHDVTGHIRFDTEVVSAVWSDDDHRWRVTIRPAHSDGGIDTSEIEVLDAAVVISAVGQLNRPKVPEIPGADSFTGLAMHSAQWVDGTDLTGRRVAVVGTGASAFQVVPTVAPEAGHVTVFQRSAPWMFPNPIYHEAVAPGMTWALRHLPYYGRWYRFLLFWPACDGGLEAMRIDPDYPHQDRAISEINDAAREVFTQWMADQVGDDPDLLAKVVPDYVCLGKRTLQDNGSWLGALKRDDVDLVSTPIEAVEPAGIRDTDGVLHEVDVIVWCTGFHANRFLWPMRIEGRDGRVLSERWGDDPTALLGITVPEFPNFFMLYGPGTNLATGGSLIFNAECQVRYVMGCLGILAAAIDDPDGPPMVGPASTGSGSTGSASSGTPAIECTAPAHDDYDARLQAEMERMIWSHPSIRHTWYRNEHGRIRVLSPWRMVDYWDWTRHPDPAHFTVTKPA